MLDDDDVNALDQLSSDLENQIDVENAEFARNRVLEAANQLGPSQPLDQPSFSAAPGSFVRARLPALGGGNILLL